MSKVGQLKLELELAEAEERLAEMKERVHDPDSPEGPELLRPLKTEIREMRARIRHLLDEGSD